LPLSTPEAEQRAGGWAEEIQFRIKGQRFVHGFSAILENIKLLAGSVWLKVLVSSFGEVRVVRGFAEFVVLFEELPVVQAGLVDFILNFILHVSEKTNRRRSLILRGDDI